MSLALRKFQMGSASSFNMSLALRKFQMVLEQEVPDGSRNVNVNCLSHVLSKMVVRHAENMLGGAS